jgi:hypothetical protein
MSFHITVICADPAVEATIAAALEPSAIAASSILHAHADLAALIGDVSWLSSPAEASPRSDLAIVYDSSWNMQAVEAIVPIFPPSHIMLLGPRCGRSIRAKTPEDVNTLWFKIHWLIVPFDPEEFHLRIYHMLKTARAGLASPPAPLHCD